MKKAFLFAVFVFIASFSLQAAKKVDGYYIGRNGTRIDVTFLIQFDLFGNTPQIERLQHKVTYLMNDLRMKLSPDDAREISFTYKGITYRMISVTNTFDQGFSRSTSIFLKLEADGMIRLFTYYATHVNPGMYNSTTGATSGGGMSTSERYILQKGNGELVRPRNLFFKKDVLPLFDDCEEMNAKVKAVSGMTIQAVIREYNEKCK